jgi:hypothetical protein
MRQKGRGSVAIGIPPHIFPVLQNVFLNEFLVVAGHFAVCRSRDVIFLYGLVSCMLVRLLLFVYGNSISAIKPKTLGRSCSYGFCLIAYTPGDRLRKPWNQSI